MWTCPKCSAKVDPTFEVCWSCGTTPDGVEDPTFVPCEAPPPPGSPLDLDMPKWDDPLPVPGERQVVIDSFVGFFGPRAAEARDYVELDWSQEEWTRGCYGAHFAPGVWTRYGDALREPIGPIYWAGTETATEWGGYMDGAVQSGRRAATEVLATLA